MKKINTCCHEKTKEYKNKKETYTREISYLLLLWIKCQEANKRSSCMGNNLYLWSKSLGNSEGQRGGNKKILSKISYIRTSDIEVLGKENNKE